MTHPHDQAFADCETESRSRLSPYEILDQPLPRYYDSYTWSPKESNTLKVPTTSNSRTKNWAKDRVMSFFLSDTWDYQNDKQWHEFIQWVDELGPPRGASTNTNHQGLMLPRRDAPIGIDGIRNEANVVQLTQAFQTEPAWSVMRIYPVIAANDLAILHPKTMLCTTSEQSVHSAGIRTDILFRFSEVPKTSKIVASPDVPDQTPAQLQRLIELREAIATVFSKDYPDVLTVKTKTESYSIKTVLCIEVKDFGFIVPSQIQALASNKVFLTGPNAERSRTAHPGTRAIIQQVLRYATVFSHRFIAVADWRSILMLDLGVEEKEEKEEKPSILRPVRWVIVDSNDTTKAIAYLLFLNLKAIKGTIEDHISTKQARAGSGTSFGHQEK